MTHCDLVGAVLVLRSEAERAESGVVGLTLFTIGGVWCLFRLPGAVRRVGTARGRAEVSLFIT